MKYKKLELLAPAGSFEAIKAACLNGADAVYFGGGRFNARINAGNFTDNELVKAIDYAHERGVKAYITLNTLVKNHEINDVIKFAAFAYREGADAVIVQDGGLLKLLGEYIPELPIHASTQMTVTNLKSVNALEALGVKRVVLSRELSIAEIYQIASKCHCEIEVFVHGALCVSYSGQCLMSSFIGGRSGNRGLCAQPCRLPWSISRNGDNYSNQAYIMSPRDIMADELLPELQKSGITTLKLEGRMKSPEYVAIITSVYRKYLDILESTGDKGYSVDEKDREKLLQAFNRGGFTQNYLKGDRTYKNLVYTSHPKNQGILLGTVTDCKPLYARVKLDKPLIMGDGIEIMDQEKGAQSLIVTAIVQENKHVKEAQEGSNPWVGDIKNTVKKDSLVYKTYSKALFEEARRSYEGKDGGIIPLNMSVILRVSKPIKLTVTDNDGNSVAVESAINAEKALNKPLTVERIREQLQKTGDTPYYLNGFEVDTDYESTIPVSVINLIRREAVEKISKIRVLSSKREGKSGVDLNYACENVCAEVHGKVYDKNCEKDIDEAYEENFEKTFEKTYKKAINIKHEKCCDIGHENMSSPGNTIALTAWFNNLPARLDNMNGLVERVYIPIDKKESIEKLRKEYAGQLFLIIPAILKDYELNNTIKSLVDLKDSVDGFSYGNLGALEKLKEIFPDKLFCADYNINIFNNKAAELQSSLGAQYAVLSPELNLNEVKAFERSSLKLETSVYGRIPLMTMEHCPGTSDIICSGNCQVCNKGKGYLKDRKGEVFPYIRDPHLKRTRIFNAFPLFMDDVSILKETALSFLRLNFLDEDSDTILKIVKHYHTRVMGYEPELENIRAIKSLKDKGFTKGHWFRGVE